MIEQFLVRWHVVWQIIECNEGSGTILSTAVGVLMCVCVVYVSVCVYTTGIIHCCLGKNYTFSIKVVTLYFTYTR